MSRIFYSIVILILFITSSNNIIWAQNSDFCKENNQDCKTLKESNNNSLEKNKLTDSLFDYTKASVDYKFKGGISIYSISQNGDSRYNVGYALGKSVIQNNPMYARDLKKILIDYQSQWPDDLYQIVLKVITNSLNCWLMEEMKGFAKAVSINNDHTEITITDLIALNTVGLWFNMPKEPTKLPPISPTSVTPLNFPKKFERLSFTLGSLNLMFHPYKLLLAMSPDAVEEGMPLLVDVNKGVSKDFFIKNQAVMIYKLDDMSFINFGFSGLLVVESAMNEKGIVLSSLENVDHNYIEVMGKMSPEILTRIAIETSNNPMEAMSLINFNESVVEETFSVSDENGTYIVKSNEKNDKALNLYENPNTKSFWITNMKKTNQIKHLTRTLTPLINTDSNIKITALMDLFQKQNYFNILDANTPKELMIDNYFSCRIFDPHNRIIWVQILDQNTDNTSESFIKFDFKDIDDPKTLNLKEIIEELKDLQLGNIENEF